MLPSQFDACLNLLLVIAKYRCSSSSQCHLLQLLPGGMSKTDCCPTHMYFSLETVLFMASNIVYCSR